MEVSAELGDDMVTIMSGADQFKISHVMKFFWDKQQKCLKSSSTGIRHHPMIIRWEKKYWFLNSTKRRRL